MPVFNITDNLIGTSWTDRMACFTHPLYMMPSKDTKWGQQRKQFLIIFRHFLTGWWSLVVRNYSVFLTGMLDGTFVAHLLPKSNEVDMKSSHGAKAVVLEYCTCIVGCYRCVPYMNWSPCFVVGYYRCHHHHREQKQQQTTNIIIFIVARCILIFTQFIHQQMHIY